MIIATHSGTFHADEIVALAILTYLYKDSKIIRSRDPAVLETADLIIDVSGINDARHFDHHSPQFQESRPNGVRYATAGLIWRLFGPRFLEKLAERELDTRPTARVLERSLKRLDREVMEYVDLDDNGDLTSHLEHLAAPATAGERAVLDKICAFFRNAPTLPYLVAMANLPSTEPEATKECFENTVSLVKRIMICCAINALATETGISKVLALYDGGPLLILRERLPWSAAVLDYPEIFTRCLIAVYPDRNDAWRIQSLPMSAARRFENRLSAPPQWRGLNDGELDAATGLNGLIFVHRSGFTGGAHTYEDCLKFAKLWLKMGVTPQGGTAT